MSRFLDTRSRGARLLGAVVLSLVLASCGGGGKYSAPRQLDNACEIIRERPHYLRAMQDTQRKWGIPVHVQMAIIHQESKFIGDAQTPHRFALGVIPMGRQSTAYGYSQALNGTWEEYLKAQSRRGAKRDRIEDATDFMGWYMDESEKRLGIPKTDAESHYLAYHEGRAGYTRQSYLGKPWLVDVAKKVGSRSEMYRSQLETCRR